MNWLNKLPFLDSVSLFILCLLGLVLRVLPGSFSVVYKIERSGVQGGAASFALSIVRRDLTAVHFHPDTMSGLSPAFKESGDFK